MTLYQPIPEIPEHLPVFPLPNVVLFPGSVMPLHVFEPRYRAMVRDAVRGAGLIALALLKPGWAEEDPGAPQVHAIGCAGKIEQIVRTRDGRFYFNLRAATRVRFLEFDYDRPYRIARCRSLPERMPDDSREEVVREKMRLLGTFAALLQEVSPNAISALAMDSALPAGLIINRMCVVLEFDPQAKQRLLELDEVGERGRFLEDLMEAELRRAVQARRFTDADGRSGEN